MLQYPFHPFPGKHTARIQLRQLLHDDTIALYALRKLKSVHQYTYGDVYNSISDVEKFIQKTEVLTTQNDCIYWAISTKTSSKLIGTFCYWNFSDEKCSIEIGYELHPDYHRQGIMQEVFPVLLKFGFKNIKAKTIVAFPHKNNLSSIRLLKKFNFKRDEKMEEEIPADEMKDNLFYYLNTDT